ncbi:hypothetical protein ACF09J_17345 [Streptomyces sp. NPDC014889]|uniref:hypothetical protein n=1 Tax=Streptomyces sp. NPDC014889 TaxID=3364928 RepID=UPI0036F86592
MAFVYGKILCAAAGAEELADPIRDLITWYAVMVAILLVALVVMLLKTRRR